MRIYSTLWNADNWATRGGLVKINWASAPFIARFRNFRARACKWAGATSISQCAFNTPANWWTSPFYSKLSYPKYGQMKWVRDNYMIYDYCKDTKRFNGQMPPECFKQQFWYDKGSEALYKKLQRGFDKDCSTLYFFYLQINKLFNHSFVVPLTKFVSLIKLILSFTTVIWFL